MTNKTSKASMSDTKSNPQHGGKRQGAGRKQGSGAFGEATKVMRIPQSQVTTIEHYLKSFKNALKDGKLSQHLQMIVPQIEESTHSDDSERYQLPLYSHKVVAGFPSPADDYIETYLDLNEKLVSNKEATFLLRVQGDSMQDVGIYEGDILIVDRSENPTPGKIVIAALDGELTVKRLVVNNKGTFLAPENPNYPLIPVTEESDMVIWGVVKSCIHSF